MASANATGKYVAAGSSFNKTRSERAENNKADEVPPLPWSSAAAIRDDFDTVLSGSIWVANFKRAIRGMLRLNPAKANKAVLFGVHEQGCLDADKLGLSEKDSFQAIIDQVGAKHAGAIIDDVQEGLIEKGVIKSSDSAQKKNTEVQRIMRLMFGEAADEKAKNISKKIYEKYSRGSNFEESDVELTAEQKARMDAEREEKLKKAAEERQRATEQFKKEAAEANAEEERRQAALKARVEGQKAFEKKVAEDGGITL
jgi:hypothetical protein